MRPVQWWSVLVIAVAMLVGVPGGTRGGTTAAPEVEPQAMTLLDGMAAVLAQAERFSVTVDIGYDVVQNSGEKIEFGETRTIVLPTEGPELNNDGDELSLIDANNQVRHHVKYKVEMVKYGSVISFREEGDLDEFLLKLNQGLQSIYYAMREDVLTPRPVDEQVRFVHQDPPHVIYLVLESFLEALAEA